MITCTLESGKSTHFRHVAVSAIAHKDGKILLVKRLESYVEGGKWDLPGGFLDRGETVSRGALRELAEETGWQGKNPVLFRINSNPNRPGEDWQNVSFVFLVKAAKLVKSADDESTQVQWFSLDSLPPDTRIAFDHPQDIRLYKKYREKPFALPVVY